MNPQMVCHSLYIKLGSKLVKHDKRNFHPDIETQVKEEVEKLIIAGFIKPVKHPTWLANIVLVKKKGR